MFSNGGKVDPTNHISNVRYINLKLFLGILCLLAIVLVLVLVPAQMAQARGFMLKVNLFEGKDDSGKVTVYVLSEVTDKNKSKSLDVGRIAAKTGNGTIERLVFRFTDKLLLLMKHFQHAYIQRIMVRLNVNKLTDTMRHLQSCGSKCHANVQIGFA